LTLGGRRKGEEGYDEPRAGSAEGSRRGNPTYHAPVSAREGYSWPPRSISFEEVRSDGRRAARFGGVLWHFTGLFL